MNVTCVPERTVETLCVLDKEPNIIAFLSCFILQNIEILFFSFAFVVISKYKFPRKPFGKCEVTVGEGSGREKL